MSYIASLPVAVLSLGIGLWLVLPRGNQYGRAAGAILVLTALGLLAARLPMVANWRYEAVLWLLGGITVVSGIGSISMRSPVYCALWFAMALLGTGGLMLLIGAQFLAVATVVVYAGAIVVTFLFVLMLAQPSGETFYDRLSWEPLLSALAGAVMVFLLSLALESGLPVRVAAPVKGPTPEAQEHVAAIGGVLFSRYLIAVQVAGVLLLVALVAASAILAQHRGAAGGQPRGAEHDGARREGEA